MSKSRVQKTLKSIKSKFIKLSFGQNLYSGDQERRVAFGI